jgi:SAM-dependent methyltransferase
MNELRARSFGNAAEHYERGRPVWPAEAIDATGVPTDAHVLDLGAGTGKLTRLLAERFAHVTAVEPDDAMRELIRWGDVREGSAEQIPLPDSSVDAVFAAEAFHWFANETALAEIARVLRQDGTLALLWTRSNGDTTPPVPDVDAFLEELRESIPGGGATTSFSGEWKRAFDGGPFEELYEAAVPFEHSVDRAEYVSYLLSQSSIAARPPEQRAEIAAELNRIVAEGRYVLPMRVEIHTTRPR